MPIRGQKKAYENGGILDEYSVQVGGTKYPILSDKYKGFLSNKTRNGIAKMNKIKKMTDSERSNYLGQCNSVLCLDTDVQKADLGDAKQPANKSKEVKIKDVSVVDGSVNIPMDAIPESIEALVKSVKTEMPKTAQLEEQPTQTMAKGGMVYGASHSNGGVDMNIKHSNKKVELEGGEMVVNKISTNNFKQPLKKMNDAGNNLREAKTQEQKAQAQAKLKKMREKLQSFKKGGVIPKGEVKPIDTQTKGLNAQLQKDDKIPDKGMYQVLINKYFTVLDFTRVLAYTKLKNKQVESMKPEEILETSQDLAQELKISKLKYMGNDVKMLKAQLYELMALNIGMSRQIEGDKDFNNVGFILDIESLYGDGSKFNKDKFKQSFMSGGTLPDITDQAKAQEQKTEQTQIVNAGIKSQSVAPLETKPVYGKLPSSMETKNEGSFIEDQKPSTRKMFNLADAVLKYESSNAQRFSKPINEALEEFKIANIFRFKKDDKPKTFQLF